MKVKRFIVIVTVGGDGLKLGDVGDDRGKRRNGEWQGGLAGRGSKAERVCRLAGGQVGRRQTGILGHRKHKCKLR